MNLAEQLLAWVMSSVGRKIVVTTGATTEVFSYQESDDSERAVVTVTYTDSNKTQIESIERTG